MRLLQIPGATRVVLNSIVKSSIRPEETPVFPDAGGSSKALAKLGIDPRPRILPWAHTAFGHLETWLRGTFHGVRPKPLQHDLDEFRDRFDRRWREDELFGFVRRRVVGGEPLPYRRLVAERAAWAECFPSPGCIAGSISACPCGRWQHACSKASRQGRAAWEGAGIGPFRVEADLSGWSRSGSGGGAFGKDRHGRRSGRVRQRGRVLKACPTTCRPSGTRRHASRRLQRLRLGGHADGAPGSGRRDRGSW